MVFLSLLRDNNYIKDFPQLADGLMVIPLPVEEQCRGVLSEPLPNLQLLTGTSAGLRGLSLSLFSAFFSSTFTAKVAAILVPAGGRGRGFPGGRGFSEEETKT